MGTDESVCMVEGPSTMPESDNIVQGSEQEKELREVVGSLKSEEGRCEVTGNENEISSIENQGSDNDEVVDAIKNSSVLETEVSVPTLSDNVPQVLGVSGVNGDGFSSTENQGLGDDMVVGVIKNCSVLETKVSVPTLSDNVCQVLADSEVNGMPTWLGMQGSDVDRVFSSDGAEKLDYVYASDKLDYMFASESRVSKAAVLGAGGLVGVGEDEGTEDCDGDAVRMVSGSRVAEAVVLSVDGSEGVGGEEARGEGKITGSDGDAFPMVSDSRVAEPAVLSVDGSGGVGGEDAKNEGNIKVVNTVFETRGREAAVLSVDGLAGVYGNDIRDGGRNEEVEKDENCCGIIVTIEVPSAETREKMDVEVEDLSDEQYDFAVGSFVWGPVENHPWWPGRIYDPSDASDFALKLKQKNRLLVAYFGNGTFAWCHPSQLKPFEDNFNDMVKKSSSVDFVNAVQVAANEVGRLLHMKLSRPLVDKKTSSQSTFSLVKNSGIKEGVSVPENGIVRLDGEIEPAELLSYVKLIAQITDFPSILELEILKAQLSAYYLSKGGYKLPDFMDPQSVPGVEDSLMDETVAVDNSKSTVEVPTQGPFDELSHSPVLTGNISNPVRKQKSIAEIMGEDREKVGDGTVELMNKIVKKRKGSEIGKASKPVQEKKELLLDTDGDVSSAENDDNEGKENRSIGSLLHSKYKKEVLDEGNRNEKGNLSRERKKSKYLCFPFTTSIGGQGEGSIETESLKVSRKARVSQRKAGSASVSSFPVYMGRLFDSSNYLTQKDDGKKIIDPKKVHAPVEELLSQVHNAAVSPQICREGSSLHQLVDFTYAFRSSLSFHGSLRKVHDKSQRGEKRKKPDFEDGMFKDHNLSDENISSLRQYSGPKKKRRKEAASGKKGTDEYAAVAVLLVSFFPGSTMPSRSDLISVFSKFGALNEAETDMFCTNYTARVSFLRKSDAENAFKHSQINNPFGTSSDVTFQLQYLSDGSKSGERSKHKSLPAATPSVSLSQGSEASKLIFIQQKLQGLTLMLEASGDKSPDMMAKLESEMKALLEDVSKMVEASLF